MYNSMLDNPSMEIRNKYLRNPVGCLKIHKQYIQDTGGILTTCFGIHNNNAILNPWRIIQFSDVIDYKEQKNPMLNSGTYF